MKNKAVRRDAKGDRRLFFVSLIVFGITLVAAVIVFTQNGAPSTPVQPATTVGTRASQGNSGIVLLEPPQMTQAAVLSTGLSDEREDLQAMVDACGDYRDERRSQMNQHLIWLEHPEQIPSDIQFAFGANPVGRLIYGMASYTSIEWKLKDSPSESCLLPIGQALNAMLIAAGEPVFEEFN